MRSILEDLERKLESSLLSDDKVFLDAFQDILSSYFHDTEKHANTFPVVALEILLWNRKDHLLFCVPYYPLEGEPHRIIDLLPILI